MTELKEKITTEMLLEKIPAETRYEMACESLTRFCVLRGEEIIAPAMGRVEGITAPILGFEKWFEVNEKAWTEGVEQGYQLIKDTHNISVDDAVGAAKVHEIFVKLVSGPENICEIVETTPERAVIRWTQCSWRKRYREEGVPPEFIACCNRNCPELVRRGVKALNPKLTGMFSKQEVKGDPYCEVIIEFKEE